MLPGATVGLIDGWIDGLNWETRLGMFTYGRPPVCASFSSLFNQLITCSLLRRISLASASCFWHAVSASSAHLSAVSSAPFVRRSAEVSPTHRARPASARCAPQRGEKGKGRGA